RVRCAEPHAGLLVVGNWVETPAGLYHPALPIDDPDELALLGEDDLLLSAVAKERQHSHAEAGAQDTIEAFTFRGSWCGRDPIASETDRRAFTLCFDGRTVTGGGELVITGTTWHREQFGAAPPDPDDPTTNHDE